MNAERTEPWVESNAQLAKKCMALIRDMATLVADSDSPEQIGYALQELNSSLSDYMWEEPVLFTSEEAEQEREGDIEANRLKSIPANPLEALHEELTVLNSFFTRRGKLGKPEGPKRPLEVTAQQRLQEVNG